MKRILFACMLLIIGVAFGFSQSLISKDDYLLNGFDKKLAGDDFSYHSSVGGMEECLIVRASDGKYAMEWQTAPVPGTVKQKFVTLVWLSGIGSSPGLASMTLSIDNKASLTFKTDGKKEWKVQDAAGRELFFRSDMEDQHGDKFGFMFLRIPASMVEKGKPLRLKMTGGNDRMTSWCMTFKMQVNSGLTLQALPAIINENGSRNQVVSGNILYFGADVVAKLYVNEKLVKSQPVKFGANYVRIGLPEVKEKKSVRLKVQAGEMLKELTLEQFPVRRWEVNFVQHAHTDIGYTRSQTEILAEHLRYIDYALDYCDATDAYPDDAKFRWTCESAWAVDEFLKSRPKEQIERFKKRVQEGRIEITAMYFNFDELPDEQVLAASLQPVKRFRENGLQPKVAMQNDVNGIGWSMNDFYKDLGVKYLNMGTHGHRALICFDKPTLFWWESPSGNRMLAYRGEHYMHGNFLEIHKGDMANFESRLLNYLMQLGDKGYTYDVISLQHSGYFTDNSPPSTIASDLVKKWNETYEWPKIRTATATQFFEKTEARYADQFPVYRGHWPDWWTDGFGASAREVAAMRKSQDDIIAASGALSMAKLQGSPLPAGINQRLNLANNALLFYAEHTTGYSESVREPYHEQTMEQRAIKESYAWESYRRAKMIGEEAMGLLQRYVDKEASPSLVVYNSLSWNREGMVTVYIDHQIVPRNTQARITDQQGNVYPAQAINHRSDGTYWAIWVTGVPAFGFKKFLIQPVEISAGTTASSDGRQLENKWYAIKVNPDKAALTSWYDKELKKELVDPKAPHAMGEFIYERLGNRHQMEQKRLDDFKRFGLDSAWFDHYSEGPIWNSIHLKGKTAASYEGYDMLIELRLFHTTKRVELAYSIVKKPIVDPEGIYIAFPFQLENGKHWLEVQGGVMEAGKDQIPGSANDWNTVQNFTALRSRDAQIIMGSSEIPLMQFGGINTGRYQAGALPQSTHLYSWPMNNYWVTNFNPDQKGQHLWSYYLTSGSGTSFTEASHFGWGSRVPMPARVLPGNGQGGKAPWTGSWINQWPANLLLVNATPMENSNAIIIQVRETEGKNATVAGLTQADGRPFTVTQVNAIGEAVPQGTADLKPMGSGFYKLSW